MSTDKDDASSRAEFSLMLAQSTEVSASCNQETGTSVKKSLFFDWQHVIEQYLAPQIGVRIGFILYRYRFLLTYTVIGAFSLWVEIIIYRGLAQLGLANTIAYGCGFTASVFFAYWFNVRINFKVPVAKRNRAIFYFVVVSLLSGSANLFFRNQFYMIGWSYELSRFVSSAILFAFVYAIHRKLSFADYKRVGVAIYANGVEDIKSIHDKIGDYADFIHVDLIDDSYGEGSYEPKTYRMEVIQAFWPGKQVHAHLMTRRPLHWLDEVVPYVDMVIPHYEIDDDVNEVLAKIRGSQKKVGLCVQVSTPLELIKPYANLVDFVMLLAIPETGRSGQSMVVEETLDRIKEMNQWPERQRFSLCVDGGVQEKNIGLLSVEAVVSGSSVLNHPNPRQQIMRLQTSSSYETI